MALLPGPRLRVTTAAGVVVSGGKLRLYNTGTTTLTSIYTDAAMVTPAANPLVAASDGVLPQFFAPDGTVVDGDFLTAGGVVIAGQSFVAATFVGANSGVLTRDFTNSRLRIAGSGGIVSIEGGDPSGDDVGGKLRFGGYNGTQADSISLDAAAIDTTTNTFTVNGSKLTGVVSNAAVTFSAVSTLTIPLTNTPTGVRAWEVQIIDLICSNAGSLVLSATLSYDNAASFKTGAGDYEGNLLVSEGGSITGGAFGPAALMTFSNASVAPANKPGRMTLRITTPNSGSDITVAEFHTSCRTTATGVARTSIGTAYGLGGYGRATHIKLAVNAGTFAGVYRVAPQRGFGE